MSTTSANDAPDTDPEVPIVSPPLGKPRLGFPWGLLVALALYGLAVVGYAWATYWRTDDYKAAQSYAAAWQLIGHDEGLKATPEQLTQAYALLLETARMKPEVKDVHDQLERLNWRFEERGLRVPEDLRRSAEAVAVLWLRIQQAQAPILVVGVRDRGWAPDQVVEGPKRLFRWSPIGGFLIVMVWAYGRYNSRRVAEQTKESELQHAEHELAERQRVRERMSRSHPAQGRRRSG